MMQIRLAKETDYGQLAEMKWLHCEEDEADYGEEKYSLNSVDKETFQTEFVLFMKNHPAYRAYTACDGETVASAMFVYLIPKTPKPGREQKYIAYLTNVFTRKEYRNQSVGARLMQHIQTELAKENCELIFAWPSEKAVGWYGRMGFSPDDELRICNLTEGEQEQ